MELNDNLPYPEIIKKIISKGTDQLLLVTDYPIQELESDEPLIKNQSLHNFLSTIDSSVFHYKRDQYYSTSLELFGKLIELNSQGMEDKDLEVIVIYHISSINVLPLVDLFCSVVQQYFHAIRSEEKGKINFQIEKIISDEKTYFQYVLPSYPMTKKTKMINHIFQYLFDHEDYISSNLIFQFLQDMQYEGGGEFALDQHIDMPSLATVKNYYSQLKGSIQNANGFADYKTRGFALKSSDKKAW